MLNQFAIGEPNLIALKHIHMIKGGRLYLESLSEVLLPLVVVPSPANLTSLFFQSLLQRHSSQQEKKYEKTQGFPL